MVGISSFGEQYNKDNLYEDNIYTGAKTMLYAKVVVHITTTHGWD